MVWRMGRGAALLNYWMWPRFCYMWERGLTCSIHAGNCLAQAPTIAQVKQTQIRTLPSVHRLDIAACVGHNNRFTFQLENS
jgi:hypothetical protein